MKNDLFLTSDLDSKQNFKDVISKTVNRIVESFSTDSAYCGPEPNSLSKLIQKNYSMPEKGLGFDSVLDIMSKDVIPNFLHTSSTNYMAHLHSPALVESIAAELLIATYNQSMDSWDQSPVATEVEVAVVKQLCALYGFSDNSDGCFTSGGSQSNLTGLLLARDWFCQKEFSYDVKKFGLPPQYQKLRLYTSEISHFSMDKGCHLMGLGYDAVVKVPVDQSKKMNVQKLEELVQSDLQHGYIPFCIVATIGTTDYGSIDDVSKFRKIADKFGMWLHCDAAYGSALVLSKKYSNRMGNLSLADSLTVDFHKMFLLPISCSAVLIKDASNFETLELHADYLNREEDEADGYTNLVGKSLQTTRRFDALKVWVSFQVRGKEGFSQIVDTCVENATFLYSKLLENKNFETVVSPEISSVVFRVVSFNQNLTDEQLDLANKIVRRKLIYDKNIVIGQTVHDSKVYLKCTLLNPMITHEQLSLFLENVVSIFKESLITLKL